MTNNGNGKTIIHVSERELQGKAVKRLRTDGLVPANIYGQAKDSDSISIDAAAFQKFYAAEGDSGLMYLAIEGKKKEVPVLIDEVQFHPVTDHVLHVSFRRVNLKEKIRSEVPIVLVGENEVPEAAIITVRDALEVEALPTDLPENFTIDISTLTEIGQSVTIADLEYDKETVEVVMTGEMNMDAPVVLLQEIKEEVIEEEPEEELEGVEAVVEGEEGEAPEAVEELGEETPTEE